jgi:hypothetical protein
MSQKTKQHHVGIIAVPVDAPKLVQELIPRILRASLSVDSEAHCIECEAQQRGLACIMVASSFIAAVTDDAMREKLIGELSGFVGEVVAHARAEKTSLDAELAKQGMSCEEACDAAVAAGAAMPLPPEETSH